ncbi:MAG TPA: type II toxin-antitoxin system HicB family antitoxin [Thermoanaerobaculia bacterium]|jgi:predicted RNase H-like HicB family nuclease|nr:type II toxin-antitoxin system HicB family antitoxin [Thermoanaerobaculia bacterium]
MSHLEARELLKKPYTRVLIPDEESGTLTARLVEFPGCFAQGDNPAEAYERLEAAAESWIEAALEMRQVIPPPTLDVEFSGRFALRLPRSLHSQAAALAELDGTSLNQFIVSTLAEKVGAVSFYRSLTRQFQAAMASTLFNAAKLQLSSVSRFPATAGTRPSTALLQAGKEVH